MHHNEFRNALTFFKRHTEVELYWSQLLGGFLERLHCLTFGTDMYCMPQSDEL